MPLKIAAFYGILNIKAGAAGAFLEMIKALRKRGHEIDVYTLKITPDIKEELEKKVKVNVFTLNFNEWKLKNYTIFLLNINALRSFPYLQTIKQKIIKNQYDIFFAAHSNYSPLLIFLLRNAKIPKVYYCFEPPRLYYEPLIYSEKSIRFVFSIIKYLTFPIKYLDRIGVKCADLVLCGSYYEREYIWRTYSIFPVVNYLGVDSEKHKRINIKKENMILSVGVLSPLKAHDFIIRALGLIPKPKRPKLIIITSGYLLNHIYKRKLYTLAKEKNVELEIKESYISDMEFAMLHSKAKLFVIPYIMEPSVEPVAFAYKLPIVAVKEGGTREVIINNETGLLVDRDEKEFAEAIEYLLDRPDIAKKMGENGRKWIMKNFTWEKCAENLERNFKKVLKKYANSKGADRLLGNL
jgi:glycosyltransferase involved in cell wall biosynthesis